MYDQGVVKIQKMGKQIFCFNHVYGSLSHWPVFYCKPLCTRAYLLFLFKAFPLISVNDPQLKNLLLALTTSIVDILIDTN